jgi:hypothetical protein
MIFSSKIIHLIVLITAYNNIIIKSLAQLESTNDSLVIDLSDNKSSVDSSTESEVPSNETTSNTTLSSFGTELTTNETIDKNSKTTESEVMTNNSSAHWPLFEPEEESIKFGSYFGVSLLVCALLAFLAVVWFVCWAFVQSLDESDEQNITKIY